MTRQARGLIVMTLLFGAGSVLLADDNWPEFRGPSGNGHSTSTGLPKEWSESKNVVWKTAIHDMGWSSPVVWGDQVWLTSATPDGRRLYAFCVDRKTGKILLDEKLFDVPRPKELWKKYNSYASPSPAIEEGRVYVHFGTYGTACLDTKTFKVIWERRDLPCDHHRGAGSSPIIYKNLIILQFDGFDLQYAVALDKKTGKTVWKADRTYNYGTDNGDLKKAYGTPTVVNVGGAPQLISPAAKATVALDPMTGKELWRVMYDNHSFASRPFTGNGLIYLSTGFGRGEIVAVRPGGRGDVTRKAVAWKAGKNIGSKPSPVLVGDSIYVVDDKSKVLNCLDAKTGESRWKERLSGNAFSASPVFGDGVIYIFAEDGTTTVVQPGGEFKVVATNKLPGGGRCMGSPAIAGKSLFLRTATHLYRVEKK